MKKALIMMVCATIIVFAMGINVFADTTITPRFNNVLDTATYFSIDSSGNAEVTVSYTGDSTTQGATIKIKIQKQFLFFFWTDVVEWVDETSQSNYVNSHSIQVDSGTYKATVEYTIRGTGGSPDVITDTIERTH